MNLSKWNINNAVLKHVVALRPAGVPIRLHFLLQQCKVVLQVIDLKGELANSKAGQAAIKHAVAAAAKEQAAGAAREKALKVWLPLLDSCRLANFPTMEHRYVPFQVATM